MFRERPRSLPPMDACTVSVVVVAPPPLAMMGIEPGGECTVSRAAPGQRKAAGQDKGSSLPSGAQNWAGTSTHCEGEVRPVELP